MIIEVLRKDIYGRTRFYPLNRDTNALCKLMEKKTLSPEQLQICRDAEWQIYIEYPKM